MKTATKNVHGADIGRIEENYETAARIYEEYGVDTDRVLRIISGKSISLHCWSGDDVTGFETHTGRNRRGNLQSGGIAVTGKSPGKAATIEELMKNLETALSFIPGKHRVNLHAMYGDFGHKIIDRNEIEYAHFERWVEWAKRRSVALDFNATLFSHPNASDGFTLSSPSEEIREFWIEHVRRCRKIGSRFGKELGSACIHNLWVPDGMKDTCVGRREYRHRLLQSLDDIYSDKYDASVLRDSIEQKLFGIGSETCVFGSHELYLGYAVRRGIMPCLDTGHFHPTENIGDKISSLLLNGCDVLIHLSRGIRWDSDHVVLFDDCTREIMQETVRSGAIDRVYFALDYFDASIDRIAGWVIGARSALKSLLYALLEPVETLQEMETAGNYLGRMALLEEMKTAPFGAVWDYWCAKSGVPIRSSWMKHTPRV